MNGPDVNARPLVPAKGEKLRIEGIEQWTDDTRTRTALKRLVEAKAPRSIAQMVLWNVTNGTDWDGVGRLSKGWGNAHEIALARRFVAGLEGSEDARTPAVDPGLLCWDIQTESTRARELAEDLRGLWGKGPVLGLTAKEGVPTRPDGPALACRIELDDSAVAVKLEASHPSGTGWVPLGEFRIKLSDPRLNLAASTEEATPAAASDSAEGGCQAARLGDALAEGMLGRVLRVNLTRGPVVKGKATFKIKIHNESPLILNGLALGGPDAGEDRDASVLAGLSVPPRKSLTVPGTAEMVERLHLRGGVRILAADLSGL